MQIQNTMYFHLSPIRKVGTQISKTASAREDVGEKVPWYNAGDGGGTSTTITDNSMEFFQIWKLIYHIVQTFLS